MTKTNQALTEAHAQIQHIVGNIKGGVIDPTKAVELLDKVLLDSLNAMRYPGEPVIEPLPMSEEEKQMAEHFNQADKDK